LKCVPILIASVLFQSSAAFAADVVLLSKPFDDHLFKDSQVNGDIIVGVMLTGTGGDGKMPVPRMDVPSSWLPSEGETTKVCVHVVAKNGRFVSENVYGIEHGARVAEQRLEFPTRYPDYLKSHGAAVRISRGDCSQDPTEFAPAYWTETESSKVSFFLDVYLNAGGNHASVASDGPGGYAGQCDNIAEGEGLKYTALCRIPLGNLNKGDRTALFFAVNRNSTVERFQADVVLPAK